MARIKSTGTNPALVSRPVIRIFGVCALALTTANCSNNPQRLAAAVTPSGGSGGIDSKYGVKASPRLYAEGDVIPKGGGRRFSGKPYVVAGRTYVPREDARGYVREGLASWYGAAFHGRMTANGEVFDRHSIAAAHPTLPLPSYARVTNLNNGYSMVVRVNDRGPYHANRVMDVSEEVARALDFHRKGTERVRVEYVGKASTAGSDDRKLLASLRTDGRPAATGGPIMVADLGPDQGSTERFSRSSANALAFRPAAEAEQPNETTNESAPEPVSRPQPRRLAPIVVANVASVPVPSALQPTASRTTPFKPQVVADARSETPSRNTIVSRQAPLNLAPPPIRLASLDHDRRPAAGESGPRDARVAAPKSKDASASETIQPSAHKPGAAKPTIETVAAKMVEPKKPSSNRPLPVEVVPIVKVAAKSGAPAASSPAKPSSTKQSPAMPSDAKLAIARLAAASAATPTKSTPAPRRSHLAGVD